MSWLFKTITTLILVMFLGFVYLLIANVYYDVGDQILNQSTTLMLDLAEEGNVSEGLQDVISNTYTDYQATTWPGDILFIGALVSLWIAHVSLAFKSRKMKVYSFFGFMTIGLMFVLVVLSLLEQVRTWLFDTFVYGLFGAGGFSTPWIDAFYTDFLFWAFLWIISVILVNQFDVNLINRNSGRVEE